MSIENINKLHEKINSFDECYKLCKLWGSSPDGDIRPDKLLEWLMENIHMSEMALDIKKQLSHMGISL